MMNVRECLTMSGFSIGAYILGFIVGVSGRSHTEVVLTALGIVVLVFAVFVLGGYAHD